MPHFQIHIKGAFTGCLWQSGDARHLGNIEKIFEVVRLVHKEPVNAEFLKSQRVVLFMTGGKCFEFGFQSFLGLFEFLHQSPIIIVCMFPFDLFQFIQLLLKETHLGFL